jgi:biopolymer transport protein ExbD
MRLNKRIRGGGALMMNMTPMIDVVFLLMIYFMTTLNAESISKEQLALPEQKGTQEQTETGLTINITESGAIFVVGQELTVQQLVALVSDEIGRLGNDASRLNIVVRADRRGTARKVNEVVDALVKLDVSRINIGVQETD